MIVKFRCQLRYPLTQLNQLKSYSVLMAAWRSSSHAGDWLGKTVKGGRFFKPLTVLSLCFYKVKPLSVPSNPLCTHSAAKVPDETWIFSLISLGKHSSEEPMRTCRGCGIFLRFGALQICRLLDCLTSFLPVNTPFTYFLSLQFSGYLPL